MGQPEGETGNGHMTTQRKTYSAEFKSKIAVEAIRGFKTINELAAEYGVHPHQISIRGAPSPDQYVEGPIAPSSTGCILGAG